MKLSEAIDRLAVGDTVWVKATVDRINNEGKHIRVMPNASFVYLDGHDEISITEPREDKVEVSQEFADWVEKAMAYRVMTKEWCLKDIANMGWGDWLHDPQNGEKYPCDDHWSCEVSRNKEKHLKAIYDGYTVKPTQWVVKRLDCGANDMRLSYFLHGTVDPVWALNGNPMVFTNHAKAEAVAVLVEGSVEEVAE